MKKTLIEKICNECPQSGFQIGAFHLQKGYNGFIKFGKLEVKQEAMQSEARHSSQA